MKGNWVTAGYLDIIVVTGEYTLAIECGLCGLCLLVTRRGVRGTFKQRRAVDLGGITIQDVRDTSLGMKSTWLGLTGSWISGS
jgi:hypothetical protein